MRLPPVTLTARMHRPTEALDPPRRQLTNRFTIAVAAVVFAALVESDHYSGLAGWDLADASPGARMALGWLLWAKSMMLFVPVFLASAGLRATGWHLTAARTETVGSLSIAAWLVLDVWVQASYGAHLASYLPFVGSALRTLGGGTDHLQWVGDPLNAAVAALRAIATVTLAGGVIVVSCHLVASVLASRLSPGPMRWLVRTQSVAIIALIAAGFMVRPWVGDEQLRQRVSTGLPYDIERATRAAAARPDAPELLAVQPVVWEAPEEVEVWLHNPTARSHSLRGWQLENTADQRVALAGEIASGEVRHLRFPRAAFDVSNRRDALKMRDDVGVVRSRLSYRDEKSKRGAMIWRSKGAGARALLDRVSALTKPHYEDLFGRIFAPLPRPQASEDAAASGAAPNVVLLVVESFEQSMLSSGLLARLEAWAQGGLVASRHYATTNSSHRGMFSLLYGRLALSYEAVLDVGIAPTAVQRFDALGYETAFVSTGSVKDWKRMDEFLNPEVFDHFTVHGPLSRPHWETWPSRDRRTLDDIRARLDETRPQFIVGFLMTTHFPYPYDEAFHRFDPVSREDLLLTYKDVFATSLDRERLWNPLPQRCAYDRGGADELHRVARPGSQHRRHNG
jgi:hypothetical protein